MQNKGPRTKIQHSANNRRNYERSEDHTTSSEIPYQTGDQICIQKGTTPQPTTIYTALTRSITQ